MPRVCLHLLCSFFLAVFTMFVNLLVDFQVLLPEVICQYSGGDLQLWWQSMPQFISLAFPQRRPLISSTRASRLALFDVEWHVLNAPKGVPLALSLHFMRRGNHRSEAEVLISSHQTTWLGNNSATWDLRTLRGCDRGHSPVNRTSVHRLYLGKKKDTQSLRTHKVNHAPGYTHMDADTHLDDYSRPPGASLKLFSRDLAKRERGSEMSIRGSENERALEF